MARRLLLALIRAYQRHLSPRKGFRCAYRAHTGRASCSELGRRAVRRHGVLRGWRLARARMHRCGVAHRRYGPLHPRHQAGFCDCDLPCDLGDLCAASDLCDCDWPERKKKDKDQEQHVHIPPRATPRH